MQEKILITGASGFIGSSLVDEAIARGLNVYAAVRKSSSKQFLQDKSISFFEIDLTNSENTNRQMKKFFDRVGSFDYVVHCAGATSAKSKKDFDKINYEGTRNLVHALGASGMEIKKFLLISSLATYGPGNAATRKPIDMTDIEHPLSAYARSKQKAEQFVKSIGIFPVIILKPTAVLGPRDRDFLVLFRTISKGFEISIGREPQKISLIHVRDLARVAISLLEISTKSTTYIVSDGLNYEKRELNLAIRHALGKKTIHINIPYFLGLLLVNINEMIHRMFGKLPFLHSEKFAEVTAANWACNSQPVWEALDDYSTYTLQQAVDDTAEWYKKNGWL
ncbi:MAG: SDR family NAD(P)-dependent oxidoreductase [Bacteroidetes bacterium]|nr:SDR family NAD(P)-dependent oxidoreductase [Bacteroidota bacterium]